MSFLFHNATDSLYFLDFFNRYSLQLSTWLGTACIILAFLSCTEYEQRNQETEEKNFIYQLLHIKHLENGECLVREETDNYTLFHCFSAPRVLCRADGLFEQTNSIFITSSETTSRYRAYYASIADDFPVCDDAVGVAFASIQATSEEDSKTRTERLRFSIVNSCANYQLSDSVSESQYRFLASQHGRLLLAASQIDANECMEAIADPVQIEIANSIGNGSQLYDSCLDDGIFPGIESCSF